MTTGMALGLVQYAIGRRNLPESAREVPNPLPAANRLRMAGLAVLIVAVIVAAVLTGLVTAENLSDVVVWIVAIASVIYFAVILTSRHLTSIERRRVLSFIPMYIASAAFFAIYQQNATVVEVYSDKRLDRNLFGWEMPVGWVQSINPVFIIVLSPLFALLWTKLAERQPSTPIKFAMGTGLVGVGFLLFLTHADGPPNSTPLLALVGILLVFTVAELMLSPVGLSLSTKLAPERFRTQMVALNFLSVSLGTALSGSLSKSYDVDNEVPYFGILGAIALGIGVLLALASPFVKKLMSGVK